MKCEVVEVKEGPQLDLNVQTLASQTMFCICSYCGCPEAPHNKGTSRPPEDLGLPSRLRHAAAHSADTRRLGGGHTYQPQPQLSRAVAMRCALQDEAAPTEHEVLRKGVFPPLSGGRSRG